MLAGLAISPETPASAVTDSLGKAADLLLVMTVRPGRGGQKFMPECLEKVKELRERFPGKNIQVDGGVGSGNACQCAQAGKSSLFFLFYAVASRKNSDVWKRRDEKSNGRLDNYILGIAQTDLVYCVQAPTSLSLVLPSLAPKTPSRLSRKCAPQWMMLLLSESKKGASET